MYQEFEELTPIIFNIIAVVVSFLGLWIAYKKFKKTSEQKSSLKDPTPSVSTIVSTTSKHSEISNELIVLKTKNHIIRLISTEKGLECYLFDARPEKASGLQWKISINRIKEILEKKDFFITPVFMIKFGYFSIGQQKR